MLVQANKITAANKRRMIVSLADECNRNLVIQISVVVTGYVHNVKDFYTIGRGRI